MIRTDQVTAAAPEMDFAQAGYLVDYTGLAAEAKQSNSDYNTLLSALRSFNSVVRKDGE